MKTMKFLGYKTSTDYRKLWELAHKQKVLCTSNYCHNDIDRSRRVAANTEIYNTGVSIDSYGYVFIEEQDDFESFEKRCKQNMIEWIIPHEMESKECKMGKNKSKMGINTAIIILEYFNKWRRDNTGELRMPKPKSIGIAIDTVLGFLKGSRNE